MKWKIALALTCTLSAFAPVMAQAPTNPPATPGMMTPAMRQQMMMFIQDLLVMSQNTAIDTPDGIIVLQGNSLTKYGPDLRLIRTVVLPVPPVPPAAAAPAPGAMPAIPLRNMVPAKLLSRANGDVIVVRGQQIIRLDRELRVTNQATLPTIAPLTQAELAIIAPISAHMATMSMGMGMPGMPGGMGGMAPPVAPMPE